jgi:hypothetical protein
LAESFEGFWAISSAVERKFVSGIEGFAGSLKVAGILRNFIAAVWRDPKLVETQRARVKTPKIPATLQNPAKSFLDKSRLQVPENWPFEPSWVDRDCSIHPLEKNPTHEMIHRFSTRVQFKGNRTHKIFQNPTEIQMLLPKNPRLDPQKISIKTCLFLRNFCRKKTGFSWMTQRLIKIFRIVR